MPLIFLGEKKETGLRTALQENMTKKENSEKGSTKKTVTFEGTTNRRALVKELMHDPMYVPMKEKEIAAFLQVGKEDRDELKNILL